MQRSRISEIIVRSRFKLGAHDIDARYSLYGPLKMLASAKKTCYNLMINSSMFDSILFLKQYPRGNVILQKDLSNLDFNLNEQRPKLWDIGKLVALMNGLNKN